MIHCKLSDLLVENPGVELFGITHINYEKDFKCFKKVVRGISPNPPNHLVWFRADNFPLDYPDEKVGLFIVIPVEKDGINGITQLYNQDKDMLIEVTNFLEGLSVTSKGKPVKVISAEKHNNE